MSDGDGNERRVVGTPIRMSDTPLEPAASPPELGADSDEILHDLGYSDADIAGFRDEGAV